MENLLLVNVGNFTVKITMCISEFQERTIFYLLYVHIYWSEKHMRRGMFQENEDILLAEDDNID